MCDKEFKPVNTNNYIPQLRCSKECKSTAQKIYDKKKRETIIKCATCGNDFIKKHGSAKTCSRSCGSKLREKDKVRAEKRKPETGSELVLIINKFLLANACKVN